MASVFKEEKNNIYATMDTEFYLPNYFFNSSGGFAERTATEISTLGVFVFSCLKNDKVVETHLMNIPAWIKIHAYTVTERDVTLPNDSTPTKCQVVSYLPGQKIMENTIIQDSENVERFMGFVLSGKIPNFIPYEKSREIWDRNESFNAASLGVPSVIKELILADFYRYKANPNKKFAHVIGKDNTGKISQYDYVMNNIRQVCQYTSTFAGLTFEDFDTMATTSVNRTRNKEVEAYSPIENLLKL